MIMLTLLFAAIQAAVTASAPTPVPFGVGERFEYGAKWGIFNVGTASISVEEIDTLRGQPVYHLQYNMDANAIGVYRINSTLESWTTTDGLHSLRFRQDNKENSKQFVRVFEIFPDSSLYRQMQPDPQESQPGVGEPLDDASVLFFLRSIPLEIGKTYRFNRYFRAERNPIVVKVLKQEEMELPDGSKVDCYVINPTVGERGLFSPRSDARLWITMDSRRIPVQIRSAQPWGTVTMRLQRMVLAD